MPITGFLKGNEAMSYSTYAIGQTDLFLKFFFFYMFTSSSSVDEFKPTRNSKRNKSDEM